MNSTPSQFAIPNPHSDASILVVDDTLANLQLLAELLNKRGYRARAVPSGKLALQAVQTEPPDLILLDVNMPEMSGYEVSQRLKAEPAWAEIPVIFISALHETLDKVKAFSTGGVDYITKPFQFEEVEARVSTHLELRRQKRELQASYMRLQELERQRDGLVHMVAHDMRSPLCAIQMTMEILKGTLDTQDKENIEMLDDAYSSANTLCNMVTQLLDISRMESGQMPLSKSECDLAKTARIALDSLGALAGRWPRGSSPTATSCP